MRLTRDLRNRRFWRGLAIHGLSAVGLLAAVFGLIDVLFPRALEDLGLPIAIGITVFSLVWATWRSWPYPVEQHYSTPDTKIRLETGDLFAQGTSLVIGMADTFDIETPHIISKDSVQGQFLDRVYQHDVGALRKEIEAALSRVTPTSTVQKTGNTDRYPLGTVATITDHRTHYFCVAYTSLDEQNKASSSIGVLWDALDKLWNEVRIRSNGETVSAPVIGLGQSGLSTVLPIQDAIRFLILTFMFASRKQRVCGELVIVIRPQDEKRVDMLEIQEFLRSLRLSS